MKQISWKISAFFLLLATSVYFVGCKTGAESTQTSTENSVISYLPGEPNNLNPYNTSDAAGRLIHRQLFQPLLQIDLFAYELVPVLAVARPTINTLDNGNVKMDFEIRPEAKWDNGEDITGEDVKFSLKVMNAPKLDNGSLRPYFEYIMDVVVDAENPKKFSLICDEPYMLMESALTDLPIIPAYAYDPDGTLKDYELSALTSEAGKFEKDEKLLKFSEQFNSPKFQRQELIGSGPYKLSDWTTGQRLVFDKKENWYGDNIKANHWFEAFPEKITYEIIADPTTAVVALKAGKIETMQRIDPRIFVKELKVDEGFNQTFNALTPTQFLYAYIGMNMKEPKLRDIRTRKALRLIMDVDKYDETIFYGMAERVTSFIHPSKKEFLNPNLKPYKQDLETARKLLAEAGWKDSDGNGILDMEIEGEKTELKLELFYPNVAKTTEKGVLMFKEAARKLGVEITPLPIEFSVWSERTKSHNFEMYFGIWSSSALESDPKQIWHSDSYNGGSNYVGFGTSRSDELIENLRKELDKSKRVEYYKELQQIIDDEVPYIFISATQNRVAIHKRFGNAKESGINPGFELTSFKVSDAVAN